MNIKTRGNDRKTLSAAFFLFHPFPTIHRSIFKVPCFIPFSFLLHINKNYFRRLGRMQNYTYFGARKGWDEKKWRNAHVRERNVFVLFFVGRQPRIYSRRFRFAIFFSCSNSVFVVLFACCVAILALWGFFIEFLIYCRCMCNVFINSFILNYK